MDKKLMQDFEDFVARFGPQDNVIRIGHTLPELVGIGTEYLIDKVTGEIKAKFQDGNIIREYPPGNVDVTLVPIATTG